MQFAIGRGTRVKHSTAMEWDEYKRRKKRGRSRIRYSTGRNAVLLHSSGTITDNQVEEELEAERAAQAAEGPAEDVNEEEQARKPLPCKNVRLDY